MNLHLWPTQASLHAEHVDWLIGSFGLLVALLAAPVFILSAVYLLRYRHGRKADRSQREAGNVWLETSWAVIPFLLVMVFYVWSTKMFLDQQSPPDDALTIDVIAKPGGPNAFVKSCVCEHTDERPLSGFVRGRSKDRGADSTCLPRSA